MIKSLRHFLAALTATAAVATATVAIAAPASADVATSCNSISVSGSIMPTQSPEGDYALKASLRGSTGSFCSRGTDYRYLVTLSSGATGSVAIASTGTYRGFFGTSVAFPDRTFYAPQGAGEMTLTIASQTKMILGGTSFWINVAPTQTYSVGVPNYSFSTSGMTQSGSSCANNPSIPEPIIGKKGWC